MASEAASGASFVSRYGDRSGQIWQVNCTTDTASLPFHKRRQLLRFILTTTCNFDMASRYAAIALCSLTKEHTDRSPRNPYSSIHPRDPRSSSSLFDNYPGADTRSRPGSSHSPVRSGYGYGVSGGGSPYMNGGAQTGSGNFRPATPNSKYVQLVHVQACICHFFLA